MRRLLTFATLFASLLPLPSAAEEVFNFETAWKNGGTITLTEDVTLSANNEAKWTAGSDVTLTGSHKLILGSREVSQMADALLYSTNTVSISGVTLQNQTGAYMMEASSLSLTDVTIASHSATSATAAECTTLTLSGTLTLDLNSPCNTLLSCESVTYSTTDFIGITIKLGNDFSLGDNGVTYLMEFKDVAPTLEQLKCTVTGGSGQRVTIRTEQGSAYLCLEAPEPGSATLTLIGLIALLHRRRRPCSKGIHGGAYVRG
ncbi:MAG: PEP-CTERM sorting domain-containing protein [Akkermansia sp.]